MPEKDTKGLTITNTEMAPDIATKNNYCHHKQSKISREQFQQIEEKVSEPLCVYYK